MYLGKISKVMEAGYGFIQASDPRIGVVFFHLSALVCARFDELSTGQQVAFEYEQADKGPRATSVKIVEGK